MPSTYRALALPYQPHIIEVSLTAAISAEPVSDVAGRGFDDEGHVASGCLCSLSRVSDDWLAAL